MGSYSGDLEYGLYGFPGWLLISASCYFSLSPGQPSNPASLLRGIWARKHSAFFTEANILVLLTLHISAAIVSGLPGSVWVGIHLRNCLYSAFHYSGAACFGHLPSVACSAACLTLFSEGLLALVGLSGVQCEVSILLKGVPHLPCFWTILHPSIPLVRMVSVLEWNLGTEMFYCALRLCDFNNCCPTSLYFWEGKKMGSFKFLKDGKFWSKIIQLYNCQNTYVFIEYLNVFVQFLKGLFFQSRSPKWKYCWWIVPLTEAMMESKLNWVARLNFV